MTLLSFADPSGQKLPALLSGLANWAHQHRLAIALALLFVQIVAWGCVGVIQWANPFDRDKVQEVLEACVAHHFSDQDRKRYQYRATLFKIRRVLFLGEWLGIAARSGENYRRSNTIFSRDTERKLCNTGVVGECVRQDSTLVIGPIDPESPDYAASGYLADVEVRSDRMNVRASVFFAVPIRRQGGRIWGVLVLDTTDTNTAPGRIQENRVRTDLDQWALAIKTAIR